MSLEQEVEGSHLQVEAAAAAMTEEEGVYMLFGAVRGTWGSKMFLGIGGIPGGAGPIPVRWA